MNIQAMEVNTNALEKREAIEQGINTYNDKALTLKVNDNDSYLQAGEILTGFKTLKKTIEIYFQPLKEVAHKSWKQLCDREKSELDKLSPGINHLNKEMTAYNIAQEKIREQEEERLRQEALKAEEERRLQDALQAEKEGNKEEAEAILNEPVFVPPPIVEKTVPKIEKQTMVTTWEAKIINERLIPKEFLIPDMIKINQVVRALKEKTNIPGIEAVPKYNMRGTR